MTWGFLICFCLHIFLEVFLFDLYIEVIRLCTKSIHQSHYEIKLQSWCCSSMRNKRCLLILTNKKTSGLLQALLMIGHLKAPDLPAHCSAAPPSAPIVLMKLVLLWGPRRRHLYAGLIRLRKLRPLWRRPHRARPRLSPDRSLHQHSAPNELEDGGQREERKEGNKGKLRV